MEHTYMLTPPMSHSIALKRAVQVLIKHLYVMPVTVDDIPNQWLLIDVDRNWDSVTHTWLKYQDAFVFIFSSTVTTVWGFIINAIGSWQEGEPAWLKMLRKWSSSERSQASQQQREAPGLRERADPRERLSEFLWLRPFQVWFSSVFWNRRWTFVCEFQPSFIPQGHWILQRIEPVPVRRRFCSSASQGACLQGPMVWGCLLLL